ncbi:LysM peptidoglycan-binding domain-containing protein, partial [Candidatus Uhrbacteria bacterium]|nr:LysM peptidoglycan-binding domain-containing protein [Candidatus Uhrbacteria bacterium]
MPKHYRILTKLALVALRGLRGFGYVLAFIFKPLFIALGFLFTAVLRYILLPIYSLIVRLRIRFSKILASARGIFFFFFTNRFVFHAVVFVISVAAIATQLQTRTATAGETGRRSMLYTLVTSGHEEVVQESTVPGRLVKNVNYLGSSTIMALPGIDYDYDEEQPLADMTIPGSIAVQPWTEHHPGDPAAPVRLVTRSQTETYTVQSGDTVAAIAARFGVNVGTVINANKLNTRAAIKPGDTLKIPAVSGVLYT